MYNNIFSNSISGKFTEFISANVGSPDYTNILEKDTVTENSISLKWAQMSLNTEYDLKVDGVKVPLGTKVTYDHTGLASNTEHTYQIAIKDTDNWSTEVKIKTLSLPPPPPPVIIPQNIRIAASTESSIQIVWDEVSPITEYDLEVDGVVVSVGADESYHHTGLSSGSKHTYRVGIKGGQLSGPIDGWTKTSITPEDIIPKNLRVIATTESSIQIAWDEVESSTEYEVEADGITKLVGDDESYEDSDLLSGTTHKYRVRIIGGKWSEYIFANTLDSQIPGALIQQNIRASSTKNTITITWDEIDSSTEYEIEVDGEIISTDTREKYKHINLKSNSKHKYRVRIKDGEWSPVLIVKTSSNTSSSKGSNSKNSNNDNNNDIEYDKVEVYFGNKRNFIYENQLIGNAKVNILNKIFLCNFGEDYYLGIRAWKDNKLKVETEYKLNLTPENKLIFNKSDDKVKNINFEIKETMIQGTGEKVFYVNDLENITLSKYIIDNGYVVSIDHIKMKSNKNSRYNISEDYNIGKIQ